MTGEATGKAKIKSSAGRRLRYLLGAHFLWLALLIVLGSWWGMLMHRQAKQIAVLEEAAGMAAQAHERWIHVQRMLFWESGFFFFLLLASTGLVFWLYWLELRRSRSIHAFFASVTHEVRTPLTSIRLQAETIAENSEKDPEQKTLVDRLLEDTLRLEAQVERTLELARVEGGGAVFPRPVPLRPWLERQVSSWKDAFSNRAEIDLRVPDLLVEADPAGLQVILRNLFENSLRHSKREKVRIELEARLDNGQVLLVVRDNGRGFEGEEKRLGRLFEKGPSSQGAGVGLYLISVLMTRMGGAASFGIREGFEASLRFREGRTDG